MSRERAASRTRGRPATNRYDLLDFMLNQFDRDYLEFNANIHELESALQGFINSSFENITSTEQALNMLKQFQAILQRETARGRSAAQGRESFRLTYALSREESAPGGGGGDGPGGGERRRASAICDAPCRRQDVHPGQGRAARRRGV